MLKERENQRHKVNSVHLIFRAEPLIYDYKYNEYQFSCLHKYIQLATSHNISNYNIYLKLTIDS